MTIPIPTSKPRLYFAYGSNLSLAQMSSRCPTSTYHSFGLLRGYKWIIGPRGYANVVKTGPSSPHSEEKPEQEHVVYGMLYTLEAKDEANLDIAEGVPSAYTKHELDVEVVGEGGGGFVRALVYVDERRQGEGVCREEYVARMNRGIRDAVGKGMEGWYVEGVLRRFVREGEVGGGEVVGDPFWTGGMEV